LFHPCSSVIKLRVAAKSSVLQHRGTFLGDVIYVVTQVEFQMAARSVFWLEVLSRGWNNCADIWCFTVPEFVTNQYRIETLVLKAEDEVECRLPSFLELHSGF